jgi:hypothetical protein
MVQPLAPAPVAQGTGMQGFGQRPAAAAVTAPLLRASNPSRTALEATNRHRAGGRGGGGPGHAAAAVPLLRRGRGGGGARLAWTCPAGQTRVQRSVARQPGPPATKETVEWQRPEKDRIREPDD